VRKGEAREGFFHHAERGIIGIGRFYERDKGNYSPALYQREVRTKLRQFLNIEIRQGSLKKKTHKKNERGETNKTLLGKKLLTLFKGWSNQKKRLGGYPSKYRRQTCNSSMRSEEVHKQYFNTPYQHHQCGVITR